MATMRLNPMRPQPWIKHLQAYKQFSGLNTVDSENFLGDNELVELVNMDLGERGAVRRRSGIVHHKRRPIWADVKGKFWGDLNG